MTPKQMQGIVEQEIIKMQNMCGITTERAQALASLVNEWSGLYEIIDQEED